MRGHWELFYREVTLADQLSMLRRDRTFGHTSISSKFSLLLASAIALKSGFMSLVIPSILALNPI